MHLRCTILPEADYKMKGVSLDVAPEVPVPAEWIPKPPEPKEEAKEAPRPLNPFEVNAELTRELEMLKAEN